MSEMAVFGENKEQIDKLSGVLNDDFEKHFLEKTKTYQIKKEKGSCCCKIINIIISFIPFLLILIPLFLFFQLKIKRQENKTDILEKKLNLLLNSSYENAFELLKNSSKKIVQLEKSISQLNDSFRYKINILENNVENLKFLYSNESQILNENIGQIESISKKNEIFEKNINTIKSEYKSNAITFNSSIEQLKENYEIIRNSLDNSINQLKEEIRIQKLLTNKSIENLIEENQIHQKKQNESFEEFKAQYNSQIQNIDNNIYLLTEENEMKNILINNSLKELKEETKRKIESAVKDINLIKEENKNQNLSMDNNIKELKKQYNNQLQNIDNNISLLKEENKNNEQLLNNNIENINQFKEEYKNKKQEIENRINSLENNCINDFNIDNFKSQIIDLLFPIGSCYMTIYNFNPSSIFGGIWLKLNEKFPYMSSDISIDFTGYTELTGETYNIQELINNKLYIYIWFRLK